MSRRPTQPSKRLRAAAAAERDDITKQREAALARRKALQAEIDDLDAELAELAERVQLIDRLAGPATDPEHESTPTHSASQHDRIVLRGPQIRETAVRILLAQPTRPRALHYRAWYALLEQDGYTVAGKDPVAVFLTQLSRSPVVQRGTQSGIYEIQLDAVDHLQRRLDAAHRELRALTSGPADTADLTGIRTRRTSLTRDIDRLEKSLEEARSILVLNAPPLAAAG